MSTLKGGKYPKMIGGKKKKLINIMEELLGIDHLTIGTSEQLEDRKKALQLADEHKLKREGERAKWEAEKKRRSDAEEAAAKAAGFSSVAHRKEVKAKKKEVAEAAAAAVAKKTADAATTEKNAKKDAKNRGRRVKDYGFTFVGDIESARQTDIKKIITQLNDILRLKKLGLYEDILAKPNTVLIRTTNIKDGEELISKTAEEVFVAPLEEEIPDTKKE
jgi:hypothetical protein